MSQKTFQLDLGMKQALDQRKVRDMANLIECIPLVCERALSHSEYSKLGKIKYYLCMFYMN